MMDSLCWGAMVCDGWVIQPSTVRGCPNQISGGQEKKIHGLMTWTIGLPIGPLPLHRPNQIIPRKKMTRNSTGSWCPRRGRQHFRRQWNFVFPPTFLLLGQEQQQQQQQQHDSIARTQHGFFYFGPSIIWFGQPLSYSVRNLQQFHSPSWIHPLIRMEALPWMDNMLRSQTNRD